MYVPETSSTTFIGFSAVSLIAPSRRQLKKQRTERAANPSWNLNRLLRIITDAEQTKTTVCQSLIPCASSIVLYKRCFEKLRKWFLVSARRCHGFHSDQVHQTTQQLSNKNQGNKTETDLKPKRLKVDKLLGGFCVYFNNLLPLTLDLRHA